MKKLFSIILGSAAMTSVMAQNLVDAVRYSTTDLNGTAFYTSMAGALGAVGGDVTCMGDNPAGIGVFRASKFAFTPTLQISKATTDGSESLKRQKNDNFISNMAYVISIRPDDTDDLVSVNIGLGFNHSEGMNRRYRSNLSNPYSSFGQYIATRANNALDATNRYFDPEYLVDDKAWADLNIPLIALMGRDSHAIDPIVNEFNEAMGGVISYDEAEGLSSYQSLYVHEKTRMDEYNINVATNWNDSFYAGITLSIYDFNSITKSQFDELYGPYGDYFTQYDNDFETQGSGVAVKLGVIWVPLPAWRLGFAVHSPTWYDMKDYYNGWMRTDVSELTSVASLDGSYSYEYKYQSPWQLQASTAFVLSNKAILSFEYDAKDYASTRYHSKYERYDGEYRGINNLIKEHMELQHTLRAGLDFRATQKFSLRAGYAYQTSPYNKKVLTDEAGKTWGTAHKDYCDWGDDRTFMYDSSTKPNYSLLDNTQYICGGFGWKLGDWNIDFSVMDRIINEKIAAYPTTDNVTFDDYWNPEFFDGVKADLIDMKTHLLKYNLTIGYRF